MNGNVPPLTWAVAAVLVLGRASDARAPSTPLAAVDVVVAAETVPLCFTWPGAAALADTEPCTPAAVEADVVVEPDTDERCFR